MNSISRRHFLSLGAVAAAATLCRIVVCLGGTESENSRSPLHLHGCGPGRGDPPPHKLQGEDLIKARLTPETWKLEIIGDGSTVEKPRKIDDGTAIDFDTLLKLGKTHGVKFSRRCNAVAVANPQAHGLWEGVPLREVIRLAGKIDNVMRVYFNGFHNNDPNSYFSHGHLHTGFRQRTERIAGHGRLQANGGPIPLLRGGRCASSCRGDTDSKNIKWFQRIRLTSDHKYADTYGGEPDAYLKTQVPKIEGPDTSRLATPRLIGAGSWWHARPEAH